MLLIILYSSRIKHRKANTSTTTIATSTKIGTPCFKVLTKMAAGVGVGV